MVCLPQSIRTEGEDTQVVYLQQQQQQRYMNLANVVESIPLKTNAEGVVRVGGTRVTLDSVVYEFKQGSTAEEIAYQFPSLQLADVYVVITYYLRHQDEIEAYLQEQEEQAAKVREKIEQHFPSQGLKERLLAKRQALSESAKGLANK